jgi:hypothetical protein
MRSFVARGFQISDGLSDRQFNTLGDPAFAHQLTAHRAGQLSYQPGELRLTAPSTLVVERNGNGPQISGGHGAFCSR